MPSCPAICGCSSMFILTSLTLPSTALTAFSSTGASCLHGPHQGAQKSTSTGWRRDSCSTSWRKPALVVSFTGLSGGAGLSASIGNLGNLTRFLVPRWDGIVAMARCDLSTGCSSVWTEEAGVATLQSSTEDRMTAHQNARLTPLGRERIVRTVLGGRTPQTAAQHAEAPARAARKWARFKRLRALSGLADRSSRLK